MSKHIHKVLVAAAIGLMAGSAMAAGDGTINFTGNIVAASCKVTPGDGATGDGKIINVNLGTVSTDSLGGGEEAGIVGGTAINLDLNCNNGAKDLTHVKVRFDPTSGSGVDSHNNKLLAITGAPDKTASGVGIGIFNKDHTLLNLNGNDEIVGEVVKGGTDVNPTYSAKLFMRAAYVKSSNAAITAGQANGTLPFTLNYE